MSFVMMFAVVSLFTACINDDDVNGSDSVTPNHPVTEGNVTFQFVVPNSNQSRVGDAENSGIEELGSKEEYALNNVIIYMFNNESGNFVKSYSLVGDEIGEPSVDGNDVVYKKQTFMVDPGTYKVYAVANSEKVYTPATVDDFMSYIDSKSYNTTMVNIIGKGIIMSNRGAQAPVVTVKSDEHTTTTIVLERVLAKIALAKAKDTYQLKKPGTDSVYAEITPVNYNMVNLSKEYYLFRHVGTFAMADETPAAPATWDNVANFDVIPSVDGYAIDPHFFEKTVAGVSDFDGSIFNNPLKESADPNFAFIGSFGSATHYSSLYCLGNTNFCPAQLQGYTTGVLIEATITVPTERCFDKDGNHVDVGGTQSPTELYYFNYNFYRDLEAVHKIGKAKVPSTTVSDDELWEKYQIKHFTTKLGSFKCYYNYWIKHLDNKMPTTLGVMEYGIVRNNIYRVNITNILGLGAGTPDVDPNKPVEKKGYLDVDFNVMPWIVRGQDAELE